MATEFLMPKLGLTMEEATIAEWLIADGEQVEPGAAVLRIETDKTETDVEAPSSGRLHIAADVGDTFACGERIGWFLDDGEAPPTGTAPAGTASAPPATVAEAPSTPDMGATAVSSVQSEAGGRIIASPLAKRVAKERGIDLRNVRGTGPGGRIVNADLDGVEATPTLAAPPAAARPAARGGQVAATAAARQLADLLGVDLSAVPADPVDGRVSRDGVARFVRSLIGTSPGTGMPPQAATSVPALAPAMQEPTSVTKLSGMRGTIAKRMHESLDQMAQLSLFMDADLDAIVADRARRKADGAAPSYTDYVIAAAARALRAHPHVNSQITDDGIALLPDVHVGMAVALDGGLIVPVIRDTADRDLSSLAAESSRLAEAARSGSLGLPDLEGGTFSVSTLGMFGVDGFTPVINPPNTAILGVGRLRDDLVLDDDGNVTSIKRLTLSLTWDHRAFDGAPAAEFCRAIVDLLGDPAALDTPAD
ncbi:dihydrolipoamide acetyltransferase family protein [Ilumatobacter nonamiensis]|uniref:dihydrolipoamide acetyltransferase family protein n=1 Tax=Ilumatobacter nonamiensis TaxID=467093 RepID=UPI00059065AF|nr:dihydrolipoamide acetyltransferase family protein [Ilumatobacter nonamiensis]